MIDVRFAPIPPLHHFGGRHPEIRLAGETRDAWIEWQGVEWPRRIEWANPTLQIAGLIELMDNNPLVCAQAASVPDAASTLALISLGPAIKGGLPTDTPVLACSFNGDPELVEAYLAKEGWVAGCSMHCEPLDSGTVLAAKAMVEIDSAVTLTDVSDLYDESYSRSFFVRREQSSNWNPSLVEGTPLACYRIELDRGESSSLLKIQVIADREGKCGAAQAIHMFNIMNGYEESLGLD